MSPALAGRSQACEQPDRWSVAAAFELAASELLPAQYPQVSDGSTVSTIPPSILKAVGWVESGWRQFRPSGAPLVSFDFGYGVMQITSGMAGAFGNVEGRLNAEAQSRIASDYVYNIAYGARVLAQKWQSVPRVGDGDPSEVENWYYALWAYNGWGWANNPNNPRFARWGTPGTNPTGFPYQERVLYLVAHPPHDSDGNPLWQPVPVALPSRSAIGAHPGPLTLKDTHRQDPADLSAVYRTEELPIFAPGSAHVVSVRLVNTGRQPWLASGSYRVALGYHLVSPGPDAPNGSPAPNGEALASAQATVPIGRLVRPGEEITIRMAISAPSTPGLYQIVWDLQRGPHLWFSQVGAPVRTQRLRVEVGKQASGSPRVTPTSTPAPLEDLQYVADTSIPDGSVMRAKQRFDKGWLVFNRGRSSWPSGSTLDLMTGSSFGAKSVAVPRVRACRSFNIVAHLQAPSRAGSYSSAWQMHDPNGRAFGNRLTLVVTVRRQRPAGTPTPTPAPSPTASHPGTRPTPTPTPIG